MNIGRRDADLPAPALDVEIRSRLGRVCGRARRSVVLQGLAAVAALLIAGAALQFLLDYLSNGLRRSMRATLLGVIAIGVLFLIWRRIVMPLRVRFGPADAALLLERRYPQLASVLISAVRFASGQIGPRELNSPSLVASVVHQAAHRAAALNFDSVIDPTPARRSLATVFGVVVIFVSAVLVHPVAARLWFDRNVLLREVPWPQQTRLVVEAENDTIVGARGDDLVVSAHAEGVQPREVEIFYRTASGRRGRQGMVTVGSEGAYRYRYTFEKADEELTFYLRGGDDQTGEFRVSLLERPRVVRTGIRVEPPDYSKMEASVLGDGQRSVQVLRGSRVTISAVTNHPVVRATLMSADTTVATAYPEGDGYSASLLPTESKTYYFQLLDEAGLENREIVRFAVQVAKDEAPRVRLKIAGIGDMITAAAVLPLELEFEDAYGLASAELGIQISRDEVREESLPSPGFEAGMTKHSATLAWPAASAGISPGDRLALFVRARDFDDVTGPNESRSPEISLRVVTRDELLAELARREQRLRDDFERVVELQEQTRRRLITLLGRAQGIDAGPEDSAAALERTQRNIGGSVNVLRQQFERILKELDINQLNTAATQERLSEKIIGPLLALVRRDLVIAADTIRQFATTGSPKAAEKIDPQQIALLSDMRAILSNMIHQAGYQEVITMLRDIIRLQEDLKKETQKAAQEQAEGVFDD
jgi:hypothetical protein